MSHSIVITSHSPNGPFIWGLRIFRRECLSRLGFSNSAQELDCPLYLAFLPGERVDSSFRYPASVSKSVLATSTVQQVDRGINSMIMDGKKSSWRVIEEWLHLRSSPCWREFFGRYRKVPTAWWQRIRHFHSIRLNPHLGFRSQRRETSGRGTSLLNGQSDPWQRLACIPWHGRRQDCKGWLIGSHQWNTYAT